MSVEADVATLREKCNKLEKNTDFLFTKLDDLREDVHKISTNVAIMVAIATVTSPVILVMLEKWIIK